MPIITPIIKYNYITFSSHHINSIRHSIEKIIKIGIKNTPIIQFLIILLSVDYIY